MPVPRHLLLIAPALCLALPLSSGAQAAARPQIGKPRPAPSELPAFVPELPPAAIDQALAVGGDDIKAEKIDTRLSVDVQVNGRGPYRFIIDSGADTSVVGLRIARELALPLGTPAIVNGMTSRDLVDRVKVAELTLGRTKVHGLELPALREDHVGGEGIIGIDALVHKRLMMDFEDRLIKVEDARTRHRSLPGEIVVTARRKRGQLILTHVTAAGLPLDAVIDTGSEVTIGNLALRDRLIRRNRDKFVTVEVVGVTGVKAQLQVATVGELRIGPVVLNNVPMAFADLPPFTLFGLSEQPALLLGTDVLESFRRVSLDFKSRKVRFQLRKCKPQNAVLSINRDIVSRLSSSGSADVCGR